MDLLIWQMRKNCSLFITSGTLSQLTGNTSICNTSKIDFRRLEALFCGVWPSPGFSLLSSRISLQNWKKCRFEPTFKKACPARLSEQKSLISSGFRRVRGLQKRPQNGHPRHSCIKDSKSGSPAMGSWVRIPPCPPKNTGTHPGVCIFCLGGIRTGAVVNGAPGEKAPCRCRGQMKAWRFFRSRSFCKAMRTQTCKS